jgi:hypothetical protein
LDSPSQEKKRVNVADVFAHIQLLRIIIFYGIVIVYIIPDSCGTSSTILE